MRCPQVPHALEQSQEHSVPRVVSLPPLLAADGAVLQKTERGTPWGISTPAGSEQASTADCDELYDPTW